MSARIGIGIGKESVREFWHRYQKNKAAVVGLAFVLFLCFVAILAQHIAPYSLNDVTGETRSSPSKEHLFGTDELGKDTLTGVIWGSRVSLLVGILAAGFSTIIGMLVGIVAGYYGGLVDDFLMRFTEVVMVIPIFIVAVLVIAFFGTSLLNTVIVISVLLWPGTARVARSEFLRLKSIGFVESARSIGVSNRRIIFREILPNAMGPIIVTWTLDVGFAILLEAGLSFIGLGDINFPSWGFMLRKSMTFLSQAWWMSFFPGFAIFLVVYAFNLVGDGLNDALSPKLERLEESGEEE